MKDTQKPMIICLFSYWAIGFPAGYILAEYAKWGAQGYWSALILGLTVSAILMAHRFNRLSR